MPYVFCDKSIYSSCNCVSTPVLDPLRRALYMILAASEVIYMQRLLPDSPKVFRLLFILRFLPHVYISI